MLCDCQDEEAQFFTGESGSVVSIIEIQSDQNSAFVM